MGDHRQGYIEVHPDDDLAHHPIVAAQRDGRLVDLGIRVLALLIGDVDPLPSDEFVRLVQ